MWDQSFRRSGIPAIWILRTLSDREVKMKKLTLIYFFSCLVLITVIGCPLPVMAEEGLLDSVNKEAVILSMEDGSGDFLFVSDGLYCMNGDGNRDTSPRVHYFDHVKINGIVLNGYYYHDERGKFRAEEPHPVLITGQELLPDGIYLVGNLGRIATTPQVRYVESLVLEGHEYSGFYYFDENGRMLTMPGIRQVEMYCHGRAFEGYYYFGKEDGGLAGQAGTTIQGFEYDEYGKLDQYSEPDIKMLGGLMEQMTADYSGDWSIYVKNLDTEEELLLNNESVTSASLIKLFVMMKTLRDEEKVRVSIGKKQNISSESKTVADRLDKLLWDMIAVSDNESFNELVRLQSEKYDFNEGAVLTNEFLKEYGFQDTSVEHTLSPSSSQSTGIGERNRTSVEDCGRLLEEIYRGECISESASGKMLSLLMDQKENSKIPAGLPSGILCAHKTGESTECQHDAAIVYGGTATYILCIMAVDIESENDAIDQIRELSEVVYSYMNY